MSPPGDKNSESTVEDSKEEHANPSTTKPSLSKIFSMARPELPMLVFSILLMMAAESTALIIPIIIASAYDALIDEDLSNSDRLSEINSKMTIALSVYAAGIVAGFFRAAFLGIIGERMVARMRYQLYEAILRQEIAFFDEHKSGELVSRLGSDTTLLQQVISQSIPEALLGVIKGIISIALMFFLSPRLAGVSLGSVVVIFLVAAPLGQTLGRLSKAYQDVLGQAQTHSTEAFGSMRTVQAFAAEEKEINRFGKKIGNPDDFPDWFPSQEASTYRVGFFKAVTNAGFYVFIFGAGFGFLYVSLWYGFYLVNDGDMTLGDLTAFQSYIFTIGFGLGAAATHVAKVMEGLGASGRVFFLLERVPSIPEPRSTDSAPPKKLDSITGAVQFQDVSFSYPSRPDIMVLNGFTLGIAANSTTALVGSSGSGKSTVVALLQRFYDTTSGQILFDGNSIKNIDLPCLRHQIGYVQQEPQLFGLTVKENLLYGVKREVSQAEIEKACTDANAHDFIASWPNGYDTLVGERGVKLSGGQKQRIAIARALLTNCRILLLDEATSALDAESEHLVQEAIDKAVVGRTVVVVAHRLSTIKGADQIVVMDNHAIVDVGTHVELLGRCVKYQELIKRQNMTSN